ncbi:MAG: hydrogenase formation protein HypD [Candidatus Omnitrophica bacterium]|nr:hydrogenase formation protein HypD [Candidatus Omnitrophota bacterium]
MKASKIRLMEVCGTHTMAIAGFGIKKLLPKGVELISGPGCPVCVTHQQDIDRAIEIAKIKNVIMTTFGDMLRVPGSKGSLEQLKTAGADVRVVYSCLDALTIARDNPDKKIVFMGVGFETTSPTVAAAILEAKKRKIRNLLVLSNFKIIFPALKALAGSKKTHIDGFICPGHVSVITGSLPYEQIAKRYKKPCVITGFEEADIITGIKCLLTQIKERKSRVEIAYKRAVQKKGNLKAQRVMFSVFTLNDAPWRGLGMIKRSGLSLRKEFTNFSAEEEFRVKVPRVKEPKGCLCAEVLQGIKSPRDCRLFKKRCTPQTPVGPCMVSSEGACAAHYKYEK